MIDRHGRALLAAALLLLAAQSPAPAGILIPQGPWVVDYADTQCSASRKYDPGPILFAIRPAPNGETYELLLGRERSGPHYAEELEGSVDFGRGPIKAWLLHYGGSGKKFDIYAFRISAAEMATASSAIRVTLRTRNRPDVFLELDHMSALLSGLGDCTKDLMTYWNFDGKATSTITVPAKGNLVGVFTRGDYPADALMADKEGTSQFLLLIDEKGAVAGCHVQKPSGVPILDAMGCQVIRERVKMKPAIDAQGHPVRSAVVTPPITWKMQ
jgi:TonB family protein